MMHHEKNYTGNSRFYGFCVDLLAAVAREVGFSYRLELVPDRKYGARDPETGEWNGIVRQLMDKVSVYDTRPCVGAAGFSAKTYTKGIGTKGN